VKVFDSVTRSDASPGKHTEGTFDFLNRSSRSECENIRQLIEEWFGQYPIAEQDELRTRLRNNASFRAAWFELFLHSMLLRLGAPVVVHPPLPHTSRTPDFGLGSGPEEMEYLEARVVTGESGVSQRQQAVVNSVYDAINRLKHPDFLVTISRLRLVSGRQPSGKLVRDYLQTQLGRLDPDRGAYYSPTEAYRDGDVEILFRFVARTREYRGKPGRLLAGFSGGARWGGAMPDIRDAVLDKAGRYGKLGKPFVIALDVTSVWFDWHEDTCDALYGKGCWGVDGTSWGAGANRGIFHAGEHGYSRVSAVLVTEAAPWHVGNTRICLYHNPFAKHPYEGVLCRLPQARFDNGKLTVIEGLSLTELFGLTSRWPYDAS
jgi:hypothetical protein